MLAAAVLVVGVLSLPAAAGAQDALEREGRELYVEGCISCHGPRGEGVPPAGAHLGAGGIDRGGPSLVDAGAAAADFYLRTGRMPLRDPDEQPRRSEPAYTDDEIEALVAYVASLGEGPTIPRPSPEEGDVARGLAAYTTYCAGCHQVVGEGGIVPGGTAPELEAATPTQIAEAVRIGPWVMPAFDERTIDERTLDDIISYLQYANRPDDEGGWAIGHLGPIPEGLVAWLLAGGALVAVAVVIGQRAR